MKAKQSTSFRRPETILIVQSCHAAVPSVRVRFCQFSDEQCFSRLLHEQTFFNFSAMPVLEDDWQPLSHIVTFLTSPSEVDGPCGGDVCRLLSEQ